jgi:hypothetical protein
LSGDSERAARLENPPCISNWKNAKGYTIPLDKRLAADGRGLQQTHINEKFAKLAESLFIADRKAREAVEMRAQMEKKLAKMEKEKKEEHLRMMAQKARDERAGIGIPAAGRRVLFKGIRTSVRFLSTDSLWSLLPPHKNRFIEIYKEL